MATIEELKQKATDLQTALDAEQAEIKAAIDALTAEIARLNDLIAAGNPVTPAQLQEVADIIDGIKSDLEGTVTP